MGHSIWIDDKDIFEDFSLVPVTRPVVNEPETITKYVDVYGVDGPLDLSEALTGQMMYKNRKGTWEFHIKNYSDSWDNIIHRLANYIHGRRVVVRLEDDAWYYYMGRLELDKFSSAPDVKINYNLEPYKYEPSTFQDWLWDPFNFENGIIREYKNLTVDNSLVLTVPGSSRPCIPIITCSTAMTVTYQNHAYSLNAGDNRVTGILIGSDEETLTFSGSGTVSVDYRGGWL